MPTRSIYNPLITGSRTRAAGEWLPNAISAFIRVLLTVGFLAMIFYFIYGGIMWITSGGDAKRTEAAGKQITNAIIGAGLLAAGWALLTILDQFFGLDILKTGIKIPTL